MCVKVFLQSLEHEFAACILKAKKARSRGVSFHLCFLRSQSRNPYFDGIDSNRSRGSTTSSKVQTCQELAEYSSSTKQAVCNESNFHHCFHDYISTTSCNFDSGSISKDGPRQKDLSFVPILLTVVEMKDFGVQVNLPLLTTEGLKGDDLKIRFYTGFVNFGTFMVTFNSLSLITGKLNYWNGKD